MEIIGLYGEGNNGAGFVRGKLKSELCASRARHTDEHCPHTRKYSKHWKMQFSGSPGIMTGRTVFLTQNLNIRLKFTKIILKIFLDKLFCKAKKIFFRTNKFEN